MHPVNVETGAGKLKELRSWAYALCSGKYKDCRLVLPHEQWCFLKQEYREHPKGQVQMVHNPLGVFAEVMLCGFDRRPDGVYEVVSDITSPVDMYLRRLEPEVLQAVKRICDGSERWVFTDGYFKTKSFYELAKEAEWVMTAMNIERKLARV